MGDSVTTAQEKSFRASVHITLSAKVVGRPISDCSLAFISSDAILCYTSSYFENKSTFLSRHHAPLSPQALLQSLLSSEAQTLLFLELLDLCSCRGYGVWNDRRSCWLPQLERWAAPSPVPSCATKLSVVWTPHARDETHKSSELPSMPSTGFLKVKSCFNKLALSKCVIMLHALKNLIQRWIDSQILCWGIS